MAGRSSQGALTMIVTNTPGRDLAYTNFAYCSPSDIRNFIIPGSRLAYAQFSDLVLCIEYPFLSFLHFLNFHEVNSRLRTQNTFIHCYFILHFVA